MNYEQKNNSYYKPCSVPLFSAKLLLKQRETNAAEKSQTEVMTNRDGEKETDKLEKKDGYFTKTCDMISLPSDMDIYQDQNITISFGPDDGHWQSDFSLPINAARMREVNVIE